MSILKVSNLKKDINEKKILEINEASFELKKIYGIIGPNGAGKTTFLKCICGLIIPDKGDITIDSIKQTQKNRGDFLNKIGSVFAQSDTLFDLTVNEVLEEHYYFFNIPRINSPEELLKNVGLDIDYDMKIGDMSLGMRQRLLLAIAISHKPKILILDEPFNGLDPDGVIQTKKIIQEFAEDSLVIVTAHSFLDLENIVTDVMTMSKGRIGKSESLDIINNSFSNGLDDFYHAEIEKLNKQMGDMNYEAF